MVGAYDQLPASACCFLAASSSAEPSVGLLYITGAPDIVPAELLEEPKRFAYRDKPARGAGEVPSFDMTMVRSTGTVYCCRQDVHTVAEDRVFAFSAF